MCQATVADRISDGLDTAQLRDELRIGADWAYRQLGYSDHLRIDSDWITRAVNAAQQHRERIGATRIYSQCAGHRDFNGFVNGLNLSRESVVNLQNHFNSTTWQAIVANSTLSIKKGMKLTKYLTQRGISIDAALASATCEESTMCLSLHPVDILFQSSHTTGWTSCHRCHARSHRPSAAWAMCCEPNVAVLYTFTGTIDLDGIKIPRKIKRSLVWFDYAAHRALILKTYPSPWSGSEDETARELVAKHVLGLASWGFETGPNYDEQISTPPTYYYDDAVCEIRAGDAAYFGSVLSGGVYCPSCDANLGTRFDSHDLHPLCDGCGVPGCDDCGERIPTTQINEESNCCESCHERREQIAQLESQLDDLRSELEDAEDELPQIEDRVESLRDQIASLESELENV